MRSDAVGAARVRSVRKGSRLVAALALVAGIAVLAPASAFGIARIRASQDGLPDLDARTGTVQPTAAQRRAVSELGASVSWNRFGTPGSLIRHGGYLARGIDGGPVAVARDFVSRYRSLFRLSAAGLANLDLLSRSPLVRSGAHVVIFRQTFGGLPASQDGLITVGVVGGKVAYVSSSAAGDGSDPGAAALSPEEAWAIAADDVGLDASAGDIVDSARRGATGWTRLRVAGIDQLQRVRLTAFPTYSAGVRPAYETIVIDTTGAWPIAYKEFVDAGNGAVLFRQDAVQELAAAKWDAFPANSPLDYSDADTRRMHCWLESLAGRDPDDADCEAAVKNAASRAPWDFDVQLNAPTFTTDGNNATTAEAWASPLTPGGVQRPVALDRRYAFDWTNAWHDSGCDPASLVPGGNDIDAAVTNLFVGHNRMHDFSYNLGFTETNFNAQKSNFGKTAPGPFPVGRERDPEIGNVQAGAATGGSPTYLGRDNANQITLNDGIPPITNQYLFQPIAGAFYSPCVDGDFDTSVFGHEYTHLISNRMVGGPDAGLTGAQAGAMGEGWSDLDALEFEHEYGLVPTGGENPWSVGAYVTGNPHRGIRDYPLNSNPLNFSDVGFDITGPEVHADGEIWNAVNYDIRQALVEKFDAAYPSSDAALQRVCAEGKVPVTGCPGNRRWIQIVYDAWLLMQPGVSMIDARDAYLAADMMRFGGANQKLLWRAFAARGMGVAATTKTTDDGQPSPSFRSPSSANATVSFDTAGEGGDHVAATVYVGKYQGRVTPVADTVRGTPLRDTVKFVSGRYEFVIQARGHGLKRAVRTFEPGETANVSFPLKTNWASRTNGATASGDGERLEQLIDDGEATNWTATDRSPTVAGTRVTVDLAGAAHRVSSLRVSAMLTAGQNRFTALRQFRIDACDATAGDDCSSASGFHRVYRSPPDAFPGSRPRPVAPNLILRSFAIDPTRATHLQLVVLDNQCTGGPGFQGDQDSDPANDSDCVAGSGAGQEVSAAELEAFSP